MPLVVRVGTKAKNYHCGWKFDRECVKPKFITVKINYNLCFESNQSIRDCLITRNILIYLFVSAKWVE